MQLVTNPKIRNLAIIAHVDHGKTTLVDQMFRPSGLFRENQEISDRLMDSMDLEKERWNHDFYQNCSIEWKDTKINILDTQDTQILEEKLKEPDYGRWCNFTC